MAEQKTLTPSLPLPPKRPQGDGDGEAETETERRRRRRRGGDGDGEAETELKEGAETGTSRKIDFGPHSKQPEEKSDFSPESLALLQRKVQLAQEIADLERKAKEKAAQKGLVTEGENGLQAQLNAVVINPPPQNSPPASPSLQPNKTSGDTTMSRVFGPHVSRLDADKPPVVSIQAL
jgi:hypothetical protein